jgi:hypothetical protein
VDTERRSALDRFGLAEEGGRGLACLWEGLETRKALRYKASSHHSTRFHRSSTKMQMPKTFLIR